MLDNLAFARGEQFNSIVIGSADQRRISQGFESMVQIDAPRPYLALVNVADAFAEALDPFVLRKNSLGAGAKAVQNFLGLGGVEQNDALDLGPERTHLAQHLGPVAWTVVQIVTDNHDIDRHASDGGQELFGIRGGGYDL